MFDDQYLCVSKSLNKILVKRPSTNYNSIYLLVTYGMNKLLAENNVFPSKEYEPFH